MIDCGMHFGSHGKSHFWFDSLNLNQQEFEIKESIKFLNSLYKSDYLLTMCYPYGNYNKDTLKLMKKHEFKLGLTTSPKIYNSIKDDIFIIPRLDTNDYPQND
jgi:peptidoglycan/xylan/chitin deacetylase (PgdA/CDA1 family)